MSRGRQLINNTFILGIGSILPKLTQFIVLPIYTAMLTKAEYGTYDLVNILVSLLIPVITLQIERAAFRFLIDVREKDDTNKIISNVYIFVVLVSITVLLAMGFILIPLKFIIRVLILIYLFIDILISVTRQVVRGLGNNKVYSISAIIQSVINMLFAIILLSILNWGLFGLLVSLNVANLFALLFLFYKVKILQRFQSSHYDKVFLKEMLRYSIPLVPNSISIWVVSLSDRMIVTAILGIEANAVYAVANKLPNLIKLVYGNFNLAWQESASLSSKDQDSEEYYGNVFNHLFDLLIGLTAILIAASPILFTLLIKGSYEEAYYQMPFLYLGIFFSTLSSYYGGIYVALKRTKQIGFASIAVAVINIIVNLVFIKQIGIYAASISTLVSYLLLVIYRTFDLKKLVNIKYQWKKIFFYLLVIIIMAVLNYQRETLLDIINAVLGCSFALIINWRMVNKLIIKFFRLKYTKNL
ncbi:MAG TPA: oligosaccharide flippase family protein [Gallicola sp.]|nr:oligosaccharide flippase family protein [Gallicola sp.]